MFAKGSSWSKIASELTGTPREQLRQLNAGYSSVGESLQSHHVDVHDRYADLDSQITRWQSAKSDQHSHQPHLHNVAMSEPWFRALPKR